MGRRFAVLLACVAVTMAGTPASGQSKHTSEPGLTEMDSSDWANVSKGRAADGWFICNKSSHDIVSVAYTYWDGSQWVRKGWRTVAKGHCSRLIRKIGDRHVYYYAEAKGVRWSGDKRICVHPTDQFTLTSKECTEPNEVRKFIKVDTGDSTRHTVNLVD